MSLLADEFNQDDVKPTCLLCINDGDETRAHFPLFCKSLETVKKPILGDLYHELSEDFQWCCLTDQGSSSVMQHIVAVESSSLLLHSYLT